MTEIAGNDARENQNFTKKSKNIGSECRLTGRKQKNLLICVIFFAKFLAFLAGMTV